MIRMDINTRHRLHRFRMAAQRWWLTVTFLTVYIIACGSYGWIYG